MTWRTLVTLGFLGLSAAVVALYWVQSRPVTRVVPYLGLLRRAASARRAGARMRSITRPFSLLALLSILLLTATSLWLREARHESPRASTWLVDVGITMQARSLRSPKKTRMELAKERLLARVAELGEGEWVSLISVGSEPLLQVGFTEDKAQLRAAIQSLQAQEDRADFAAAARLAVATSEGRPFEILVFGDPAANDLAGLESAGLESAGLGPRGIGPSAVKVQRDAELGEGSAPNLSIEAFAARRYPLGAGQFEASVVVHSEGKARALVRATLYAAVLPGGGETPQDVAEFVVEPGQVARHTFARAGSTTEALTCRIERLDGQEELLQSDNVARAILPGARVLSVLVVGEESLFLTAALLASGNVSIERVAPAKYPLLDDKGAQRRFDLTIFRDVAPPGPALGAALYLGSKGPGLPVQIGKPLHNFGFDEANRSRKLFRFFDPYDTQVLHGNSLVLGPHDQALAWTGKLPLVVSGAREQGRFLSVGFAPEDSDMVLRSAFPLFIRGALEELVEEDGATWQAPGRAGERFDLQGLGVGVSGPLKLVGPLELVGRPGTPRELSLKVWAVEGRASGTFERAGFYEVQNQGQHLQYFAINAAPPSPRGSGPRLPLRSGSDPWPQGWQWLGLVAALLMLGEYYSFHRRWTA